MPLVGVIVIVPSFRVGQVVGVVLTLAVKGVLPADTLMLADPAQLMASKKVTVCGPAATLVNTLLACGVPPSSEYMYGGVPLVGVTVMVPSSESGQVVAVDDIVAVIDVVVDMVPINVVSHPLKSVTTKV